MTVQEQLLRGERAEQHVQALLANERSLILEIERLRAAIDVFSKATSQPGGPSLAMQRHDPTWQAWKALCAALTNEQSASGEVK